MMLDLQGPQSFALHTWGFLFRISISVNGTARICQAANLKVAWALDDRFGMPKHVIKGIV